MTPSQDKPWSSKFSFSVEKWRYQRSKGLRIQKKYTKKHKKHKKKIQKKNSEHQIDKNTNSYLRDIMSSCFLCSKLCF